MKNKRTHYKKPSIKSKKVKLNYFFQFKVEDAINGLMASQVIAQSGSCGCGGCGCCECCECYVP